MYVPIVINVLLYIKFKKRTKMSSEIIDNKKIVILIGANGKMGQAALSGLGKHKVITAGRSAENYDYQVDITSEES
jgi:hypothetical protein